MSRTKGLSFHPTCKLASGAAIVSWRPVEDTETPGSKINASLLLKAIAVARILELCAGSPNHNFTGKHEENSMSPA